MQTIKSVGSLLQPLEVVHQHIIPALTVRTLVVNLKEICYLYHVDLEV